MTFGYHPDIAPKEHPTEDDLNIKNALAYAKTLGSKSVGVAVGELMVTFNMDETSAKTMMLKAFPKK